MKNYHSLCRFASAYRADSLLRRLRLVLAYNLARPGQLERGTYPRTIIRLAVFGVLASAPFIALGDLLHAG
ncbi:hypothetical protein [Marinobacterium rhizophilum]|uniref:hypothetical protein n=1 Tax=Marinobacterium rhizophilum TaxID=420402 RepID=UPI001F0A0AF0|nr:hypothetical protein [Marinobacterium rhizophilum]